MASTSGEYSMRLQQLCKQMPLCQLSEDELIANPEFTKLLMELSNYLDESGLSQNLRSDLDMVQNGLRLQKKTWLEHEVVYRLLQEMLQEYHCKKKLNTENEDWQEFFNNMNLSEEACRLERNLSSEKIKLHETLDQCMLVAECTRLLDQSPTPGVKKETLLGLNKEDLLEFLPPAQDVQKMRDWLQKEIETRLRKKCVALLSIHNPRKDDSRSDLQKDNSDRLKSMKTLQLMLTLQDEKRRLESKIMEGKEIVAMIDQQKIVFPPVLLRCLSILQQMATKFRLGAQSDIDRRNAEYLNVKCNAMFLKIRTEEQQVLMDTYTPQKLEVHKFIRDSLDKALRTQEQEIETSRMLLKSYEKLGPRYQKVLEEYTKLKKDIASHKWALAELQKTSQ